MYSPRLNELYTSREIINRFKGYENNSVIDENAFSFTENAGFGGYPTLSPRKKRVFFNVSGEGLQGLTSKESIAYINNGSLYYGGVRVTDLFFPSIQGERRLVSMGARLIIFPDKVYVNTEDLTDYGYLEAEFESSGQVSLGTCMADGELYGDYTASSAPPEECKNGDLWLDTSCDPHALKQFYEAGGYWQEIASTYVRINCTGIGKDFNQYDGVLLSGFGAAGLDGTHVIRHKGDDFIVVTGIIDNAITISDPVRVERRVPDMDFVCEYGNRIWGCSSERNEIYASKLGDPTNFNSFMGISTDSYAVTVGSDGPFTGAIGYRGYLLFFKENCVHKIYGQNPPYTVTTAYVRGVQRGSHRSLVCLNETLYYKSVGGICAYEGGVPICISSALGDAYYTDAVAGGCFNRYYVCMSDRWGQRHLFVYDEDKAQWLREDNIDVREFSTNNCNLYFIARVDGTPRLGIADGENIYGSFTGELKGFYPEGDFPWEYRSGLWGLGLPDNKYYSDIVIRASGTKGARISLWLELDSSGKWVSCFERAFDKTGSVTIPYITPRCDHMRIKLVGRGDVKIYSISRKTESGSDLNV